MNFEFTAEDGTTEQGMVIPFIEDARADFAPYYNSMRNHTLEKVQGAIGTEMGKLGGYIAAFVPGAFSMGGQKRYGYEIQFVIGGKPGLLRVAGLPIRSETDKKKLQVRIQALMNVADWLKSAVTAKVFSPGFHPLVPYMLVDGTNKTIGEHLMERNNQPQLTDVIDGVVVDE